MAKKSSKKNGSSTAMQLERQRAQPSGFSGKALVGTLAILAIAMLIFMMFDSIMPFRRSQMLDLMLGMAALSTLTIIFSVVLIYTYLKDYLELKSSFTLALLLAIISFLMFGISSNPFVHLFFGVPGRPAGGLFAIAPLFFAALALGILAWVSNK